MCLFVLVCIYVCIVFSIGMFKHASTIYPTIHSLVSLMGLNLYWFALQEYTAKMLKKLCNYSWVMNLDRYNLIPSSMSISMVMEIIPN